MDYDNKNFSISQAQYTQGAPSHIVVTSAGASTNTTNTDSTSQTPPLMKTTSQKSGGIGTGAIAGIAAAVIILALLAAAFCLWKFKFKKSRQERKNIKGKSELEDNSQPKGVQEYHEKGGASEESMLGTKRDSPGNGKEAPRTPPVELEGGFGGPSNGSMSMEHIGRAELPSPDPFSRHELESPGLGIRSELSTPEPPSELSTSDRNLVPELNSQPMAHELTSREIPHELSTSKRDSRVRPHSLRNNSLDSDVISPHDSASIRPSHHERQVSQDSIPTPASPSPRRPSFRFGPLPRRHSGHQRPGPSRLNSASSLDTIQTRFNESAPTQPGGNTPSVPPPQPLDPYGARSNGSRLAQGSPSPLGSPLLGNQPSPALSAFKSPALPASNPGIVDNGPPTPNLDISSTSAEREPLMDQSPQQGHRSTRFAENLTGDPEAMTREERERETERERRDEAEGRRVRTEKERIERNEDRIRRERK